MTGSLESILIAGVIIGLGQMVYAALGFGAGLFSITLLSLVYGEVAFFVPLFLLLCLPVEIWISIKDRKRINLSRTWKLLLVSLPFMVLGSFFLQTVSEGKLLFLMGFIVIATAMYYLKDKGEIQSSYAGWTGTLVAGSISGLLGSLFGMSGPPLVVFFKSLGLTKTEFRVALTSVFLVMGLTRGVIYAGMGLYSIPLLKMALPVFPFSLAGLWLGNWAHYKVNEALFRKLTSLVLMLSGLALVLKNWPF